MKPLGSTVRRLKGVHPECSSFGNMTIGTVVDTNDPQQMGRLRVLCPTLGDNADRPVSNLPWVKYISPFGGSVHVGSRGPDDDSPTDGPVTYGMWAIPKVGAQVLVACIDGNTEHRIWLGCLYGDFLPHTMPHGRYTYQEAENPNGPLSSTEDPIQPLYDNLTEAFGDRSTNFEWRSRGADNQCSYVDGSVMEEVISFLQDDREIGFTEEDGKEVSSTQGYARSRVAPNLQSDVTGKNYDSQIYSWTTPGFHGLSMDDKPDNCRMRLRSSSGHQILLDDTNERIYVATAEGKCWIEMDQNGNIDVHSDKRISFHAAEDINFTTEKAFRVKAEEGIHLQTPNEFRLHVGTDSHIKTVGNLFIETLKDANIKTDKNVFMETGINMNVKTSGVLYVDTTTDTHIQTGTNMFIEGGTNVNIKAGTNANMEGGTDTNIKAGTNANMEGGTDVNVKAAAGTLFYEAALTAQIAAPTTSVDGLDIAGPFVGPSRTPGGSAAATGTATSSADPADPATPSTPAYEAFWTNRIPDHEPWGRIMMILTDENLGNQHVPELTYTDPNVGIVELGETTERGPFWHR